jgi:hypothetical protein
MYAIVWSNFSQFPEINPIKLFGSNLRQNFDIFMPKFLLQNLGVEIYDKISPPKCIKINKNN